jgi:hypothetical protein
MKEIHRMSKTQKRMGFNKFKSRFVKPSKAALVKKLKENARTRKK